MYNAISQILPEQIVLGLKKYNYQEVYEIRMRVGCPVVLNYRGRNEIFNDENNKQFIVSVSNLEFVLKRATEFSLYAYNEQLKQGFITTSGGLRIGVAGESVNSDKFMPTTIKNVYSINIRIPHEVIGCSDKVMKFIKNNSGGIKSTLIISPPGAGKTTLLRDVARNISHLDKIYNTLVVDERFEIAATSKGLPQMDVGCYSDVVSGANKYYAFTSGIRALKPDIIITDELFGGEDVNACKRAMSSGVKVVASIHADDHRDVMNKEEFKSVGLSKIFERYIVLSGENKPGDIKLILDENFNPLYF